MSFYERMRSLCTNDPLREELKTAAFEVLLENPGSELEDWISDLIEMYPTEVVDALGTDPEDVESQLADMWSEPYFDPATGLEMTYSDWAITLCNEMTIDLYYALVDAKKQLS